MKETTVKGMLGVTVTVSSAAISWLQAINLFVQIGAGVTAIVVGIFTIRYYRRKTAELKGGKRHGH